MITTTKYKNISDNEIELSIVENGKVVKAIGTLVEQFNGKWKINLYFPVQIMDQVYFCENEYTDFLEAGRVMVKLWEKVKKQMNISQEEEQAEDDDYYNWITGGFPI